MAAVNRESDKFVLRLPDGLRDRIKKSAEENHRSMNAEIIATLESRYPPEPTAEEISRSIMDLLELAKSNDVFQRSHSLRGVLHGLEQLKVSLEQTKRT